MVSENTIRRRKIKAGTYVPYKEREQPMKVAARNAEIHQQLAEEDRRRFLGQKERSAVEASGPGYIWPDCNAY